MCLLTCMLGDLAIEGFTCMIIFKNLFSFGLTLKAFDWLTQNRSRAEPIFNALGAVQIVASVLTIPLCKLAQRYCHQMVVLKMLTPEQISTASGFEAFPTATTFWPCSESGKCRGWLTVLFDFFSVDLSVLFQHRCSEFLRRPV